MLLQNSQLLAMELGASGTQKKDPSKTWQIYRYKFTTPEGARWMTSFEPLDVPVGAVVDLTYLEKDNPKNADYPFLNVQSIKLAIGESESDKKYNVVPVGGKDQSVDTGQPTPVVTGSKVEHGSTPEVVEEVDMSKMIAGNDADEDADRGMMTVTQTPVEAPKEAITEVTKEEPKETIDAGDLYDL